jgi:diaminohydroxyphosphoribosylaminopyrimidine deaminase/5-amino-6-(5-phosphoribosylamino)uracil reductase
MEEGRYGMRVFSDPAVGIRDPFMRRACELALLGRGTVSPNPLVGCVVVVDGEVVGDGYHHHAGGPHAEVVALDAAGERARGAHVYVTLEPCNHVGRTPPCTEKLIVSGVSHVTIGMPDPNPTVTGRGADALQAAGIGVTWMEDPGPFADLNEAWLHRLATSRPFVRVKIAVSLDGHIALADGARAAITGPGGAALTHRLRSEATAVAVGARTLASDDPLLTVRDVHGVRSSHQPLRVVLARDTVPEPGARLFAEDPQGCAVVIADSVAPAAFEPLAALGVCILHYPVAAGLQGALRALADHGVDDVLVEAGSRLFTALWDDSLIDELVVVTAGGVAGPSAPPLYRSSEVPTGEALAWQMAATEAAVVGEDAAVVWRPRASAPARAGEGSDARCSPA